MIGWGPGLVPVPPPPQPPSASAAMQTDMNSIFLPTLGFIPPPAKRLANRGFFDSLLAAQTFLLAEDFARWAFAESLRVG
jgi:hypothetical protein